MQNIVPCKLCMKNFDYKPGPNSGARQFCDTCRRTVDETELKRIEDATVIEGNRYLLGAPKRKNEYDMSSVLLNNETPELDNDSDRFVFVIELAEFINRVGITGIETSLNDVLDSLPLMNQILFFQNISSDRMEQMAKSKCFLNHIQTMVKVAIPIV